MQRLHVMSNNFYPQFLSSIVCLHWFRLQISGFKITHPIVQCLVEEVMYISQCEMKISGGGSFWRVELLLAPDITLCYVQPRGTSAYL